MQAIAGRPVRLRASIQWPPCDGGDDSGRGSGEAVRGFQDFDVDSEMLLIAFGEGFLRITGDHAGMKRRVVLVDSRYKTLKAPCEGPFGGCHYLRTSNTNRSPRSRLSGGLWPARGRISTPNRRVGGCSASTSCATEGM